MLVLYWLYENISYQWACYSIHFFVNIIIKLPAYEVCTIKVEYNNMYNNDFIFYRWRVFLIGSKSLVDGGGFCLPMDVLFYRWSFIWKCFLLYNENKGYEWKTVLYHDKIKIYAGWKHNTDIFQRVVLLLSNTITIHTNVVYTFETISIYFLSKNLEIALLYILFWIIYF